MIYLIISIILLAIAHIFKTLRQKQFVEIYEEPNTNRLLRGLSIGYALNLVLPLKLGTIYRIVYPGKKMKNGVSFSFATVIIDVILDFFTVTAIYGVFYLFKFDVGKYLNHYLIINITLIVLFLLSLLFKKYIKKLSLKIAGIFNDQIELRALKVFYYIIAGFKDMLVRINKIKLLIYTIVPWVLYVLSYYFLGKYFRSTNIDFGGLDIFNLFYSASGLTTPTLYYVRNLLNKSQMIVMLLYVIIPIVILYLVSFIKIKNTKKSKYVELLPHNKIEDRLSFLQGYFNGENSDYYKTYIKLNEDAAIIEDYSAGSNATTMLCSKDGKTFYRKYSFGKDADKLHDQIVWIHKHEKKLTLTKIINEYYDKGVCSYDMPYVQGAVTCFNYVHTTQFKESWRTLKSALVDIDKNLHSLHRRPADRETIEAYVESKVIKNIDKIEKGHFIKPLLKYKYIYINGKKYHNLSYFNKYLNKDYLYEVFKNDYYSDIHGDFTIENIVFTKEKKKGKNFYIIDPNTGNLHDSPYLDYGKLLQSIHGGYEFLMNTKKVNYQDDKIEFLFTKSSVYYKLFDELVKYLEKKFGREALKSIFYHEVIHWLRLMPYKIEKNGERSLLFYAGLIMVLNDVEERFEK